MSTRNSEKGNLVSPVYSMEILTGKKSKLLRKQRAFLCAWFSWIAYSECFMKRSLAGGQHVSSRKLGLLNHFNNNLIIEINEWCQHRFIFRTSLTFIWNAFSCYRLLCLTQGTRTLNRFTTVMFIFFLE